MSFFDDVTEVQKKYGAHFDPQAWNRMRYDRMQDKTRAAHRRAVNKRTSLADQIQAEAEQRRAFYDENIVPLKEQMRQEAEADLNPDNAAIDERTLSSAISSGAVSRGMIDRALRARGETISASGERKLGLSQALGHAASANAEREVRRQRGLDRTALLARMGQSEYEQSLGSLVAANTGITNYYDNMAGAEAAKLNSALQVDKGLFGAVSNVFKSFADGGEVQLDSGDFVMTAAAVKALGEDYFDNLVEQYSGAQ